MYASIPQFHEMLASTFSSRPQNVQRAQHLCDSVASPHSPAIVRASWHISADNTIFFMHHHYCLFSCQVESPPHMTDGGE
jgi:hypothetical protein